MLTFAERLKKALDKKKISQAEAARRCGISQQSINYIISNNVSSSKLGPAIASALKINPEWLIYGTGSFEEAKIYQVPLIHSLYMLNKFLKNELGKNSYDCVIIDTYIGNSAFAYLVAPKEIVVCSTEKSPSIGAQYLTIKNSAIIITDNKEELSFSIFEWRKRYVNF